MKLHIDDPNTEELTVGVMYDLVGIKNCDHEVAKYQDQPDMVFRVGLEIGTMSHPKQALVEIYCSNRSAEPDFSPHTQMFQFCWIKHCVFTGVSNKLGLETLNFRVFSNDEKFRFIWIGHEFDFWGGVNNGADRAAISQGSVFGDTIPDSAKQLSASDQIGQMTLAERVPIAMKLAHQYKTKRKVFLMDGSAGHRLLSDKPPMHL